MTGSGSRAFTPGRTAREAGGWSWWHVLSYACLILRGYFWVRALRVLPLRLAYPLLSLNYLIVPLLARIVLEEPLTPERLPAGALILVGVALIGAAENREARRAAA